MPVFIRKVHLPVSAAKAFAWHERPGAFERLTPPWENVRVVQASGGISEGSRVKVRVQAMGPVSFNAVYRHLEYEEGRLFVDVQEHGPFRKWRHEHRFVGNGPDSCVLEDHIEYEPPIGGGSVVRNRLDRMFRYRHTITFCDLLHEATVGPARPLTVLVSGSGGMVGRALCARLTTRGHAVRRISRSGAFHTWDPARGEIDTAAMDGVDAVVHLAGEPIAQRWTPSVKERILGSRVAGAELLVQAILRTGREIAYVSASGINFYGASRSEDLGERAGAGDGFLAQVCREWESAAEPLAFAGLRSSFLRTGVVLSPQGGALAKMLPVFRAGIGGSIGSGRQQMSWVSLDDLVEVFLRAVEDPACCGAVNAVAPKPVSNRTFTRTLSSVLRRPALFPVPKFVVNTVFGEMGKETLLSDLSVRPELLDSLGHGWRQPGLEGALRHCLGREEPKSDPSN